MHWALPIRIGLLGCAMMVLVSVCKVDAKDRRPEPGAKIQKEFAYRASTLTEMPVKNTKGEEIGHVEELVIDMRDGRVRYGILSFGGFLGFGDKLFPIPWSELTLRHDELDTYFMVDVSREFLARVPSFSRDQWPSLTMDFAKMIDSLFPKHGGTVVATTKDWLAMTYLDDDVEHSHAVASNAKITRDGKEAQLGDLKKGDFVNVTTEEQAGIRVITKIEAHTTDASGPVDEAQPVEAPVSTP